MDQMIGASKSRHEAEEVGQLSMFDLLGGGDLGGAQAGFASSLKLPAVDPLTPKQRLEMEKELLGVYVSSHPLQQMVVDLTGVITCTCGELNDNYVGKGVVLAGNIVHVNQITTKKGDRMAFVTLEDLQGQCDVTIFPKTWEETKDFWQQDKIVVVRGKAREARREDQRALRIGAGLRRAGHRSRRRGSLARRCNRSPPFQTGMASASRLPTLRRADRTTRTMDLARTILSGLRIRTVPLSWKSRSGCARRRAPPSTLHPRPHWHLLCAPEQVQVSSEPANHEVPKQSGVEGPPSSLPAPLELRITIQRTADAEKDKKLLSWVYDLLRGRPGTDRFCIIVRKNGSAIQLDFPNDTTEFTPALEQQLTRRLGAGSVEVKESLQYPTDAG